MYRGFETSTAHSMDLYTTETEVAPPSGSIPDRSILKGVYMSEATDKFIADAVRSYLKTLGGAFSDVTERSVRALLESHSHLRSLNIDIHSEYEKYLEDNKKRWKAQMDNSIVEEFIREKLRKMTLQEVVNFIGEDNGR